MDKHFACFCLLLIKSVNCEVDVGLHSMSFASKWKWCTVQWHKSSHVGDSMIEMHKLLRVGTAVHQFEDHILLSIQQLKHTRPALITFSLIFLLDHRHDDEVVLLCLSLMQGLCSSCEQDLTMAVLIPWFLDGPCHVLALCISNFLDFYNEHFYWAFYQMKMQSFFSDSLLACTFSCYCPP